MPGPALSGVVGRAVDAANDHDTDRFVSCFAPEGAVDDWGRRFEGHEAIRGWSDREFIGVQVTLEVLDVAVAGATTTVLAQVGGEGFRGRSHFAFTVDGDAVTLMAITG